MSARLRKGEGALPLLLSALLGVTVSLLLCGLLAVAVYRGAIGEKGSRILSLLCPVLGSAVAALRCFSKRDTALLKQSLLLLLLNVMLYLPLLLLLYGGLLTGRESLILLLRCLCGILLGSLGVLQKGNKRNSHERRIRLRHRNGSR